MVESPYLEKIFPKSRIQKEPKPGSGSVKLIVGFLSGIFSPNLDDF